MTYPASRQAVDLAEVLSNGQAGEEGGGKDMVLHRGSCFCEDRLDGGVDA